MLFDLKTKVDEQHIYSASNDASVKRAAAWLASRIERTKRGKEMEFEAVDISPALAELMLDRNTHNKGLRSRAMVRRLVKIIVEGRWKLTPQGIAFDREGQLLDGQHRLTAIIESGTAVPMVVCFGAEAETFRVIDTGRTRTASDVANLAGTDNAAAVAAGTRLYMILNSALPLANTSFTPDEILETLESHPEIEEAGRDGLRVYRHLKIHSTAALIAALAIIKGKSNCLDQYDEFVDRLAEGENLRKGSAIHTLREGLISRKFMGDDGAGKSNNARRNATTAAAIILGWNRHVAGRSATTPKSLRWDGTTEFPEAI